MPRLYELEVYRPGSVDALVQSYTSPAPFSPIAKGDLIDLPVKIRKAAGIPAGYGLLVVHVMHMIMETESGPIQRTIVYTTESDKLDEDTIFGRRP